MHFSKLLLGILIIALALLLQTWLPVGGLRGDFVLAALIAFVFVFPFWELVFFILAAVFVMNWQPAFSADLLLFALLPLAVYVLRLWLAWEPWVGTAASIAGGIFAFYAIMAPGMILPNLAALIADALACLLFGEAVVWGAGG